jgi:probable rRNA maturation factor
MKKVSLNEELIEKLKGSVVNVSFVGDVEMQELNLKYRGKDYATDVLSFEIEEKNSEGNLLVGEIVVNLEQAKRQAPDYDNTLEEEISELVGHGILHLLGVHHEHDE